MQVSKRTVRAGDAGGGLIASYVNVDDRRRAEQSLVTQSERTRAVLDSVLVGIITVGDGGIEWMNRSARRMFGGELTDFIGRPIADAATDEAEHPFRQTQQLLAELDENEARTFECRVHARDDRVFWVAGNAVLTGGDAGTRQLTVALLDIDRRREAEATAAQTQASLRRIIETAPLAIVLRDAASLRVLQTNHIAAISIGRTEADIIGRAPEALYAPESAVVLRADMLAALAAGDGVVTRREYKLPGAAGEPRVWDVRYQPLATLPGQPPDQLLSVAADVTEQRAAEAAKLEAVIAQRELLVREVHHRIKNNLQGVAGLLQQIAQRRPEVAPVISEAIGQVQAIAQVYGPAGRRVGPAAREERRRGDRAVGVAAARAADRIRCRRGCVAPLVAARGRVDPDRAAPQRAAEQRAQACAAPARSLARCSAATTRCASASAIRERCPTASIWHVCRPPCPGSGSCGRCCRGAVRGCRSPMTPAS